MKELVADFASTVTEGKLPNYPGNSQSSVPSLLKANLFTEAEAVLRECLTIRETVEPDDWHTFNTKSMLGAVLVGQAKQLQATDAAAPQSKFTEAEPLLVQGYEGIQQRADKIPHEGKTRPTEALQRLVDLYTAWGKPDEAAKWQQKLAKLRRISEPPAAKTEERSPQSAGRRTACRPGER